jgi:hypothetical protein
MSRQGTAICGKREERRRRIDVEGMYLQLLTKYNVCTPVLVMEKSRTPTSWIPDQGQHEVPVAKIQDRTRKAASDCSQLAEREDLEGVAVTRTSHLWGRQNHLGKLGHTFKIQCRFGRRSTGFFSIDTIVGTVNQSINQSILY